MHAAKRRRRLPSPGDGKTLLGRKISSKILIRSIAVFAGAAALGLESAWPRVCSPSARAERGKITCLLGSNGSGKTTLIRAILGLTPPNRGRIAFEAAELAGLPTHRIIAAGIACIPEGRRVFPKLTVEENLFPGGYQETSKEALAARLEQVYGTFPQLLERREQTAGTMSGGEQAMVSIGRGLIAAAGG